LPCYTRLAEQKGPKYNPLPAYWSTVFTRPAQSSDFLHITILAYRSAYCAYMSSIRPAYRCSIALRLAFSDGVSNSFSTVNGSASNRKSRIFSGADAFFE